MTMTSATVRRPTGRGSRFAVLAAATTLFALQSRAGVSTWTGDSGNWSDAAHWLGGAKVVEYQVKQWRYAIPEPTWPESTVIMEHENGRLVFAGDAFGGPRVEGAWLSGRTAAQFIRDAT